MPLAVAACPKCRTPLVYGQRRCRTCAQPFDYGQPAPPEPTFAQVVEALVAAGHQPPPAEPPLAVVGTSLEPDVPKLDGLDTGRFAEVDVRVAPMPDMFASAIFAAQTPAQVNVAIMNDLDAGRFKEVGDVAVQKPADLEPTAASVGDVWTQPVSGVFRSDLFAAKQEVAAGGAEGLESTSSRARPSPKLKPLELAKITCRCGEVHRLPRCAACGTAHPDA